MVQAGTAPAGHGSGSQPERRGRGVRSRIRGGGHRYTTPVILPIYKRGLMELYLKALFVMVSIGVVVLLVILAKVTQILRFITGRGDHL